MISIVAAILPYAAFYYRHRKYLILCVTMYSAVHTYVGLILFPLLFKEYDNLLHVRPLRGI